MGNNKLKIRKNMLETIGLLAVAIIIILFVCHMINFVHQKQNYEEFGCFEMCKAKDWKYTGVNKETQICGCRDSEDKLWGFKYYKLAESGYTEK